MKNCLSSSVPRVHFAYYSGTFSTNEKKEEKQEQEEKKKGKKTKQANKNAVTWIRCRLSKS